MKICVCIKVYESTEIWNPSILLFYVLAWVLVRGCFWIELVVHREYVSRFPLLVSVLVNENK